jgi:4-hydroxythreonine-4-phosphate dehydrogenase
VSEEKNMPTNDRMPSTGNASTPIVAVTIGDPCGIGPEVLVKALATGTVPGRTVLVGHSGALEQAISLVGANLSVRAVQSLEQARFEPGCIDVIDPGTLDAGDITMGRLSPACGRAVVQWWDLATGLAMAGKVAAVVKGTVSKEAIALGGATEREHGGETFLFLITGSPLRVVHLTDHVPLREALAQVREQKVLDLIRLTHESLVKWGLPAPRIGVAGINPHAQGAEEKEQIGPAIARAVAQGIDAIGPISPDSAFRQCIDGQYDCIVAHYHDQGHIAIKTWKFDGNCALNLGSPFIRLSVPHGPAFDIAGRGMADHRSMTEALMTAASLAAGQGFPGTRRLA